MQLQWVFWSGSTSTFHERGGSCAWWGGTYEGPYPASNGLNSEEPSMFEAVFLCMAAASPVLLMYHNTHKQISEPYNYFL